MDRNFFCSEEGTIRITESSCEVLAKVKGSILFSNLTNSQRFPSFYGEKREKKILNKLSPNIQ